MNCLNEYLIYLSTLTKEELRQKYLAYKNSGGRTGIHSGFVIRLVEKRLIDQETYQYITKN